MLVLGPGSTHLVMAANLWPRYEHIESCVDSSNTDGSFTMANLNLFLSPYEILPIALKKQIFRGIFLFYHKIVCCVYSLELPHQGDSNEYTQHTIIV